MIVLILALVVIGYWWRYSSVACPAGLSWLVENYYMNTVAGADTLLKRLHLKPGMRMLDVGAGPGRIAIPAAERVGQTGEVVALDIQQTMLYKLRAKIDASQLRNIRIVNAAAGSGKVKQDYFDRALLVTVLGEIPDKHAALVEIYRALKPGAILSVTEVLPDPHYMSQKKVRSLCQQAGFSETECFDRHLAFTINFIKPDGS
jgi:ubiquinone/menaquinone biosynthesis C-methylase UbiE